MRKRAQMVAHFFFVEFFFFVTVSPILTGRRGRPGFRTGSLIIISGRLTNHLIPAVNLGLVNFIFLALG